MVARRTDHGSCDLCLKNLDHGRKWALDITPSRSLGFISRGFLEVALHAELGDQEDSVFLNH